MEKPKICFVALDIYPFLKPEAQLHFIGGAQLQQLFIGTELARRGYEVAYVTTNHGQHPVERIGPFQVVSTYKPHEGLPYIRFFYPRLFSLFKALKAASADIYYFRSAGPDLASMVLFSYLTKKKAIFCASNDPDFDRKNLTLPINFRDKPMYFWGLKNCDAIIAQNRYQQQLLRTNFKRKAFIIHNGFPLQNDKFYKKKHILWAARITPHKNPQSYITIAKSIPQERFVMIGGVSYKASYINRSFYHSVLQSTKSIPNLNFTGYLPFLEVEDYFDAAKLFVNTSNHEGFPNTFLQAWSRGIPVISFVDPDNFITQYNLGCVAESVDDMILKINAILDNKIRFSPNRIRKVFRHNFAITSTVDRYETLFKSLQL